MNDSAKFDFLCWIRLFLAQLKQQRVVQKFNHGQVFTRPSSMSMFEKTGLLSHRAFRGLVLVLRMSQIGTFPESAPPPGQIP